MQQHIQVLVDTRMARLLCDCSEPIRSLRAVAQSQAFWEHLDDVVSARELGAAARATECLVKEASHALLRTLHPSPYRKTTGAWSGVEVE